MEIVKNTSVAGQVRIAIFSTQALPVGPAVLIDLTAHANPGVTAGTSAIVIADGPTPSDLNEGQIPVTLVNGSVSIGASVSGSVFNDVNDNGRLDAGETGLAGWTVTLTPTGSTSGSPVSVTTAADGSYIFPNVAPGAYQVTETISSGYAMTAPLGGSANVSVTAGQTAIGPVFGDVQISTITLGFNTLVASLPGLWQSRNLRQCRFEWRRNGEFF